MRRSCLIPASIIGLHCLLAGCGGSTASPTAKDLEKIQQKLDDVLARLDGAPAQPSADSNFSRRLDEILERLPAGSKNPSAELAAVDAHIKAGEMQQAYDALLAAMRIAPGDQKVFEASLEFVKAAGHDENDDAMPLALDIHQRAANLIPFLPLGSLQDARSKHVASGDELFAPPPGCEFRRSVGGGGKSASRCWAARPAKLCKSSLVERSRGRIGGAGTSCRDF